MKKAAVAAAVLMAIMLSACGSGLPGGNSNTSNSQSESSTVSSTSSLLDDTDLNTTGDKEETDTSGMSAELAELLQQQPADDEYVGSYDSQLTNDYISITIPESWKGLYSYNNHSLGSGLPAISFYEAADYYAGTGGALVSINIYEERKNFTYQARYAELGKLRNSEGRELYIVAVYTTGDNYTSAHKATYKRLYYDIDSLINGIYAQNGYELEWLYKSE